MEVYREGEEKHCLKRKNLVRWINVKQVWYKPVFSQFVAISSPKDVNCEQNIWISSFIYVCKLSST